MANQRLTWNVDLERRAVEIAFEKLPDCSLRDVYWCFVDSLGKACLYVEFWDYGSDYLRFFVAPNLNAMARKLQGFIDVSAR